MAPINRSYTTLYWFAIISIALSCTIFELFDIQNVVTLKSRLGHWRSLETTPFDRSHRSSYSCFIVNVYLLPLLRYLASNIDVTLKSPLRVVQGPWFMTLIWEKEDWKGCQLMDHIPVYIGLPL